VSAARAAVLQLNNVGFYLFSKESDEPRMRIRIVKKATGSVSGIDLDRYQPGQVYDVGAGIAEYLVAEGLAIVEMRDKDRPAPVAKKHDRRRGKR
jgi:hypothetical protein